MIRCLGRFALQSDPRSFIVRTRSFLTNAYNCSEEWNARVSSPIFNKINLNDFYISLDQSYSSKGVLNATDVDIFANAINDSSYLDELRDLLYKLRLTADTVNTLESTHHATVRNYIEHGDLKELVDILSDPLTYGIFLDDHSGNILLDQLVKKGEFEQAARVASLVMLQENYSNSILCSLSQFACYKFISSYQPPEAPAEENTNQKVEEFKIRIKYLRNPYFDDHFDLKDPLLLSGKTLAWISGRENSNLNNNLKIIGLLFYKKHDNLLEFSNNVANESNFKVYPEVLSMLEKECAKETETAAALQSCLLVLTNKNKSEKSLEEALTKSIEDAINKTQTLDIENQKQLFKSWAEIRENKLNEQIKRLERAKRIQSIQDKQAKMEEEEQRLWFFENEEKLDLVIEEKEAMEVKTNVGKKVDTKSDDGYIPPEILPQRR